MGTENDRSDLALAGRLKAALDEAGMNSSELARRAGVTRSAASKWLKTGNLASKHLKSVSEILNVSRLWLAENVGSQHDRHREAVAGPEGTLIDVARLEPALARALRPYLKEGCEVWRVDTDLMAAARLHLGDYCVVDTRQREKARDIVLAMSDNVPIFRLALPPYLTALPIWGNKPADLIVDNIKTIIRGVVVFWTVKPP